MTLETVAAGSSFGDIRPTSGVSERAQLVPGSRAFFVIDPRVPGVARAFDFYGAEAAFRQFTPAGLTLVDVREEDGKGVVEMRVDEGATVNQSGDASMAIIPVLGAILAVVSMKWVLITLVGLGLVYLATRAVQFIADVFEDVAKKFGGGLIVLAVAAVAVMAAMNMGKGMRRKT